MDIGETDTMRDHWWWRPGWHIGRSGYTWHVTFADNAAVGDLAAAHADLLAELPMLDPVPLQWLHLTTQGIGFTNEVTDEDLARIVAAARDRCAALTPVAATFGPAAWDPEGVYLPVTPHEPLARVRHALRAAIADVWSLDRVPEADDDFRPHVTIGYSNSNGPADPVRAAVANRELPSTTTTLGSVSLLRLHRDHRIYQWTTVATVVLGG
ncbi:MAG TPA: 2'-5' RNA ligase family protein [Umezawaea sp.]|nr:2'-5' RNA ligase family protein [Umezawaea sp.]